MTILLEAEKREVSKRIVVSLRSLYSCLMLILKIIFDESGYVLLTNKSIAESLAIINLLELKAQRVIF